MQFPGFQLRPDDLISVSTLIAVIGLYGRFRITESRVRDLWHDFMRRTKEGE